MKEKERNAKVITFVNMKGGVAKTTLSINVAQELSKESRVLVIDMDPQFNATQSLLFYRESKKSESDFNLLDLAEGTENPSKADILAEEEFKLDVKTSAFYQSLSTSGKTAHSIFCTTNLNKYESVEELFIDISDNLFLFAGDLELINDLSGDTSNKFSSVKRFFLKYDVKKKFDYIIIDCSPTWSVLTTTSLRASDYYIIPSKVDNYSSIGISLLSRKIKECVTEEPDYMENPNNSLHCLGIIFTLATELKTENTLKDNLSIKYYNDLQLKTFDSYLPFIPSASSKFLLIDQVAENSKYEKLVNAIKKITNEIKCNIMDIENRKK